MTQDANSSRHQNDIDKESLELCREMTSSLLADIAESAVTQPLHEWSDGSFFVKRFMEVK